MSSINTKILVPVMLLAVMLAACDSEDIVFVDIHNNSSYEMTEIVLETGYTSVGEPATYTRSVEFDDPLAPDDSILGTAIGVPDGKGSFEAIKISFVANETDYFAEDSFLYSYTHRDGTYDPGTTETYEITVSDSTYDSINIRMED